MPSSGEIILGLLTCLVIGLGIASEVLWKRRLKAHSQVTGVVIDHDRISGETYMRIQYPFGSHTIEHVAEYAKVLPVGTTVPLLVSPDGQKVIHLSTLNRWGFTIGSFSLGFIFLCSLIITSL
ncbi:hypothetical protein SAMN02745181_0302 [Rubritalea squalenifaciens DSM 18772]|uniref:DUF3592 domain-containing protein n=1 Tax=Rubritalea squalenifaciens DSM 18772 TaxID=1123071 RepID=A0A1M6BT75_9BACT|nr:hypothetical protein [Rubritalea squalenifaciens]SHI51897.1 hypothetical protein SAMN02745181_0302 [Rubritalea squalenifaciens DSM 18772]